MTIVQVGRGNGGGGDGGSDLLRLEPPSDLRPAPSPLSDTSTTLQSDNNDTLVGGEKKKCITYYIIFCFKNYCQSIKKLLACIIFSFDKSKSLVLVKRKFLTIFIHCYEYSNLCFEHFIFSM